MDVDPRVEALLDGDDPAVELELIEGELFTSAPPTAYLRSVIGGVAGALAAGFTEAGLQACVLSQEPLALGPRTVVRPDAVALDAGERAPLVIVEVRTESTDRYALGPKRLAYARARVPEYWFVDPRPERIVVLRLGSSKPDYPWPGQVLELGDVVESGACPGLRVGVHDLLEGARRGRLPVSPT